MIMNNSYQNMPLKYMRNIDVVHYQSIFTISNDTVPACDIFVTFQ